MRRNGGLWMVTLRDREPEYYEELPYYFKTKAAANRWRAERESWRDIGEWPWRDQDSLCVIAAPDGLTAADMEWNEA